VLARLLPHEAALSQSTGKPAGGALLDQSAATKPEFVSWMTTLPTLATASGSFASCSSCVVHASVKVEPFVLLTVTFSLVGVCWYAVSVHWYVHVASAGCGSQSLANAGGVAANAVQRNARVTQARRIGRQGSPHPAHPLDLSRRRRRIQRVNRRTFLAGAAAAPLALASPAARARLLGGTPVVLVTADLEAAVVAVELASGRVVRRIPTMPGPRSIESLAATTAVIAHTAHGAVGLLDGPSLRVRRVLDGFAEPRYAAGDATGRHAFVSDSGFGGVAVVDVVRGTVVARLALGGPARHVSLDPWSGRLWVALGSKAAEVAVVDVREPRRPALVARIRPPFLAHDVGFAPDGRTVWVTSGDRGTIGVYEASSRELRFRLAAGTPPQHVTFAGGRAYVTSGDDGTLRVHRLADGRVERTTRVPLGSYNVQQGLGRVTTPSLARGTLCVLDRAGRLERELRVARSSHDACVVMSR
jgi:hypothetical protein